MKYHNFFLTGSSAGGLMMRIGTFILGIFGTCSAFGYLDSLGIPSELAIPNLSNSQLRPRVIYGNDNRYDLYETDNQHFLSLADASVALINVNRLVIDTPSNRAEIIGDNFGTRYGLCPEERFREQYVSAHCTGVLVDSNHIVTAGHCMQSASACQYTRFLFEFAIKNPTQYPREVPLSDVYECERVEYLKLEPRGADFAVVKLNRPVENHRPVRLRTEGSLIPGDQVIVIGHPSGLPTKITTEGRVRSLATGYFVTNLDTYGGNSGSPVINTLTGQLEGILVRGEIDFVSKNGCMVSNVCPNEGCRGEDVTDIRAVLPYLSPQNP